VEALYGIVNGTTNLILSAMADEKASYADALKRAQELGFAEADPTFDVSGMDAAQKICLLTELAFSARVKPKQLAVEGITTLQAIDFAMAKEFDYALKLLATARREPDGRLDVRVHPAFVPEDSPLSEVRGGFNAVLMQCAALGPALLYGQGAGAMPTGSAVVADIVDLSRNILADVSGRLPALCEPFLQTVPLKPIGERVGPCYLRFTVKDEPGVLARIAGVLGEKQISIASVVQKKSSGPPASIVVFTHAAKDSNVQSAVGWIDQLGTTLAPTQVIRIEEDPPLGPGAGVG
jgi:homoserine dehydrogenase